VNIGERGKERKRGVRYIGERGNERKRGVAHALSLLLHCKALELVCLRELHTRSLAFANGAQQNALKS
jgi:hypothetical protein